MPFTDDELKAAIQRLERLENKILSMEQEFHSDRDPKKADKIKELEGQVDALKKMIEKKGGGASAAAPAAAPAASPAPVPPVPPKEKNLAEALGFE